jgi:tetratricopeptide (TPR) repeat protein
MTQHAPSNAVLLRHIDSALPTHLVVVNLDATLHHAIDEMAAFLPSAGVTILHAHEHDDATVPTPLVNEAQAVRMLPDVEALDLDDPFAIARATYRYYRPELLHALRMAFMSWSEERGHERTVMIFVGAARTPAEAIMLGQLPLDATALFFRRTGALPLIIRLFAAPRRPAQSADDRPLANLFADLEQTYFGLPPYPQSIDATTDATTPFSNPFETSVWVDGADGTEIVHFLRALLRLHGDETARLAGNSLAPSGTQECAPLAAALAADAGRRLVDWASLCSETHVPRLWTAGLPAFGAVLDMGHDPRRQSDPFASIAAYSRESNWDANLIVQTYLSMVEHPRPASEDLTRSDFRYRITDEDRASKLEMARQLSDAGQFERAAEIAAELLEDDPNHRMLNRLLGTDLYVAGHRERGREILQNCIALTEIDPMLAEAERADEIATLHLLMNDYAAAISGYERAIDADPLNAHAYQGLILIYRGLGEQPLADHWLQVAQRRGLDLPLVSSDDHLEEAFVDERPEQMATAEESDAGARKRRSRWWGFFQR